MGCLMSTPRGTKKKVMLKRDLNWKAEPPMSKEELEKARSEFWETQPYYGGDANIWLVLRAAVECNDVDTSQTMLDSSGVILHDSNMTKCYDERGYCYELPNFILSEPRNLIS